MPNMEIGDLVVPPGTAAKGKLGVFYREDGSEVPIPLMVLHGGTEGPILWLSAVMHGQELTGMAVIWELVKKQLDPESLKGTVIAVPLLNPFSFTGGTYFTPQDGLNLHSCFPGDSTGSLSERMAYLIYEEGIKKADIVIDLHCNPEPSTMWTFAFDPDDGEVGAESYRLAKAMGLTTLDKKATPDGDGVDLVEAAYQLGKASFFVEFTPYYNFTQKTVDVGVRGILNVMRTLGMIEGEIEPQSDIIVIEGRLGFKDITSTRGGIIQRLCDPGEPVANGQVIGHIVDVYGDPVEEIVSPVDGWLLAWPVLNQSVFSGDWLAMFVHLK
jgi:predicted deacylase